MSRTLPVRLDISPTQLSESYTGDFGGTEFKKYFTDGLVKEIRDVSVEFTNTALTGVIVTASAVAFDESSSRTLFSETGDGYFYKRGSYYLGEDEYLNVSTSGLTGGGTVNVFGNVARS